MILVGSKLKFELNVMPEYLNHIIYDFQRFQYNEWFLRQTKINLSDMLQSIESQICKHKWFFHAGFMEISCIVVFHDVKAVVFHAEQHPDIQVCRSGVVY